MSDAHAQTPRPVLAVLCGELPPYRLHFHRRIAREIPELSLRTLLFPFRGASPWTSAVDDSAIGLTRFEPTRPAFDAGIVDVRAFSSLRHLLSPRALFQLVRVRRAERGEMRRLRAWLHAQRPAAVVCNGYGNPWDRMTIRWAHATRTPCFVWADSNIHGDRATGWRRKLKHRVVSRLLARVSGVLPCGDCGIAFFERYGVPRDRMFVCPIEPDYDQIASITPDEIDAARRRFNLAPDRKRLVVSCRLVGLKRVDTAIDAFLSIADLRPDWDLLIIGGGPLERALRLRIPARHAHRVVITGFIDDQRLVSALYRASDVLVHPAEMEAWALVIPEAAAAGLAIVASSVTGAAYELLLDGENGRFFPSGDSESLTDRLLDATSPARLEAMKRRSAEILRDWRARRDPIDGLKAALASRGVR